MKIAGLQKQSLIDFPGKISAIIFTAGCNYRCPFCHNFDIVLPESIAKQQLVDFKTLIDFFNERKDFLNGVVITGGEPTLHSDLADVIKTLKDMGYSVKLDTNGSNFKLLKELVQANLVDFVAIDIKTKMDFDKYNKAVGGVLTNDMFENLKSSIKFLIDSDIDYEFRTTFVPGLVSKDDVLDIVNYIKGAKRYCLQKFLSENANDDSLKNVTNYTSLEMDELKNKASNLVSNFLIR